LQATNATHMSTTGTNLRSMVSPRSERRLAYFPLSTALICSAGTSPCNIDHCVTRVYEIDAGRNHQRLEKRVGLGLCRLRVDVVPPEKPMRR
jgi:hypothetical protein